MLCKKGILKNLIITFITFKIRDKIFQKIEKTLFLLVHWVAKCNRFILFCRFHLSMSLFVTFQEKKVISKKCNFFGHTIVFLPTGKLDLYFFFLEYLELSFKKKHLYWIPFLIKFQIEGLQLY